MNDCFSKAQSMQVVPQFLCCQNDSDEYGETDWKELGDKAIYSTTPWQSIEFFELSWGKISNIEAKSQLDNSINWLNSMNIFLI